MEVPVQFWTQILAHLSYLSELLTVWTEESDIHTEMAINTAQRQDDKQQRTKTHTCIK